MAPTYATSTDLATYIGGSAPTNADVLLRHASGLVTDAISRAIYTVDSDGIPTDTGYAQACQEATCLQAAAWDANGVNPLAGRSGVQQAVASKSGAGVSVAYASYAADAQARSDLASGDVLLPGALRILKAAGLLTTQVQAAAPNYTTGTLVGPDIIVDGGEG